VEKLISLLILGITLGSIYSLVALGMVVIYKASKILNLAHGEAVVLLSFVVWTLSKSMGVPIWASVAIMILFGGILGLTIQLVAIRPLIGQPILATMLMTFALGFIIKGVMIFIWGGSMGTLPSVLPESEWNLWGVPISQQYVCAFIISILLFWLITLLYRRTKIGLGMRGVAESHIITQSLGVNVRTVFSISWVVSFVLVAAAAFILSEMYDVTFEMDVFGLGKGLPVLLLGGLESIPGVFIGGLIVGVAEMLGEAYLDPVVGGGVREVVPFILMLLILLFKPYGLFGLKKIERV
jgi:branched-chain amino acid transport system permease protein